MIYQKRIWGILLHKPVRMPKQHATTTKNVVVGRGKFYIQIWDLGTRRRWITSFKNRTLCPRETASCTFVVTCQMGSGTIMEFVVENRNQALQFVVSSFTDEVSWITFSSLKCLTLFYWNTDWNIYWFVLGTPQIKGRKCSMLYANVPSAGFWDLRVKGVAVAILGSLEFEDVAAVVKFIAKPTVIQHHQFLALRHHLHTWRLYENSGFLRCDAT